MNKAARGIRQQISAIAAGVTAVVIALVLFAQLAVSLQSNLHKVTDQSAVLARLVGDNAAAAIVFQDPAAATETLATLARSPLVLLGAIEQPDGSLFAEFRVDEDGDIRLLHRSDPQAELRQHFHVQAVTEPIWLDGIELGSITLWINTWDVFAQIATSLFLSLLIWLLGTAAAYFLAERLNSRVVGPLGGLSNLMMQVSATEDYSQRFDHKEDNEVGVLADSFNQMLAQIDDREKRLQEAISDLEVARDQAEDAARSKSSFLANMSHEIRTPMNGVIGMTSLLKRTELTSQQQLYFDTIEKSGRSLLMLIDDILDFTKIEAGRLEVKNAPYTLRETLFSVREFFDAPALAKGLSFNLDIDNKLPRMLTGDSGRVRQVLLNLVGNSLKFTEQGKIAVTVSLVGGELQQRIRFSVTDTGIGIDEDNQKIVFSEFFQADSTSTRQFGGTGLGLAICKQLVTLMGGKIAFQSTANVGSTFWFDLPLVTDVLNPFLSLIPGTAELPSSNPFARAIALGDSNEGTDESEQGGSNAANQDQSPRWDARVLVAEDSDVNQFIIKELLAVFGLSPVVVGNGKEAVASFGQEAFDLVLMDIQMPIMDGVEATRKLRAAQKSDGVNPECIIVGLSAHAMAGDRERYVEQGMDDYLTKPIDIDELEALLKRTLRSSSALMLWR